ncbi:MAG: hypothetical protein KTR31_03470 [Myxococcales bacterium]|nr:hypothetical protein [Myxococcales bacterium]
MRLETGLFVFGVGLGAAACGGGTTTTDCSPYEEVFVYADLDEDGFGDAEAPLGYVCAPSAGEAANNVDCDDDNPVVNPGAEEVCDLFDNDCNGLVDESHPKVPWYPDADGDGYGSTEAFETSCLSPGPIYTQISGDCDDGNAMINPLVREVCNGVDDDCDGRADDQDEGVDPTTRITFYRDRDEDTFGNPLDTVRRCAAPPRFVSNAEDCDDRNDLINPDAQEVCDNVDNDCDTLVDDYDDDPNSDLNGSTSTIDPSGQILLPADSDCDGFGDPKLEALACRSTPCYGVNNDLDCDDADPWANIQQSWYVDTDGDGSGTGDEVLFQCLRPPIGKHGPLAPAQNGVDCEPDNPDVSPIEPEICEDGIDQNCDGFDKPCHRTCQELMDADPTATDGAYVLDVGGVPTELYCDMSTDGGGWTLVASTRQTPLDDAGTSSYYDDLATLEPSIGHTEIFDGLVDVIPTVSDIRFACKVDPTSKTMDVDLSFYDIFWYSEITAGTDADSCFNELNGAGYDTPAPARNDNIANAFLPVGDDWNSGFLEGEDFCTDTSDFAIDFDDRGILGNRFDGTDWGEDNGLEKCGSTVPATGAWFIFVRE